MGHAVYRRKENVEANHLGIRLGIGTSSRSVGINPLRKKETVGTCQLRLIVVFRITEVKSSKTPTYPRQEANGLLKEILAVHVAIVVDPEIGKERRLASERGKGFEQKGPTLPLSSEPEPHRGTRIGRRRRFFGGSHRRCSRARDRVLVEGSMENRWWWCQSVNEVREEEFELWFEVLSQRGKKCACDPQTTREKVWAVGSRQLEEVLATLVREH